MEKLGLTTEGQQEKPEQNKKLFWTFLKNKFLTMALAGFITLGGGWEKSLADQLRIKIPEKGARVELVLETAITDEKLNDFKEKVSMEEPEFREWADSYIQSIRAQLGNLINSILNHDIAGQDDLEKEEHLKESLTEIEQGDVIDGLIARDHIVVAKIKKKAELFKYYQQFLDDNLDKILWGIILVEDSKAVRENLVRLVNPPGISFSAHDPREYYWIKGYVDLAKKQDHDLSKISEIKKHNPRIKILPEAFELNESGTVSFNAYINVVVHELIHALNSGSDNRKGFVDSSLLMSQLREGITQNLAFEVVQYLGTKKEDIKPIVGALNYDIRLIVAAIIESVFRAQQYEGDVLAKWHTAMINDEEMVRSLVVALQQLGLDKTIAQDISSINDPIISGDLMREKLFKRILTDMLARLKITNVNLSPKFLKAIIINNRRLDAWQIRKFEKTIELGSINTNIKDRVQEINKNGN